MVRGVMLRIFLALLIAALATLASSAAVLVVVLAMVAWAILALGGAAWYARRRWGEVVPGAK